ncbi:DUF3168 domain-containing protein [Pseudochrobactrum sp. MP213Fo]|uniref:DUF3168 domain-containing protein n=1 Tax=Pseudochrobactrum sp. MP213Fo TaxID=3022250 RepID=UPI003BA2A4C1
MTGAALALQKAILAWLQAAPLLAEKLGRQGIYDHVPPAAQFPYISFGHSQVYAWDTDSGKGEEHSIVLHIWARSNGRKQVLQLMVMVEELMEALGLSGSGSSQRPDIGGYRLVNLTLQSSQTRNEELRDGYSGQLRYRAVTEKI